MSSPPLPRSIILVGMPGSGKSTTGQRLAQKLGVPFADADEKIERAAGMSIEQIFARWGEPEFRKLEQAVIVRLMSGPCLVLATGGGAFMNETTRQFIHQHGTSVWLKADLDTLVQRCCESDVRPLLKKGNPRDILAGLLAVREPVLSMAHIVADAHGSPDQVAEFILKALQPCG